MSKKMYLLTKEELVKIWNDAISYGQDMRKPAYTECMRQFQPIHVPDEAILKKRADEIYLDARESRIAIDMAEWAINEILKTKRK